MNIGSQFTGLVPCLTKFWWTTGQFLRSVHFPSIRPISHESPILALLTFVKRKRCKIIKKANVFIALVLRKDWANCSCTRFMYTLADPAVWVFCELYSLNRFKRTGQIKNCIGNYLFIVCNFFLLIVFDIFFLHLKVCEPPKKLWTLRINFFCRFGSFLNNLEKTISTHFVERLRREIAWYLCLT